VRPTIDIGALGQFPPHPQHVNDVDGLVALGVHQEQLDAHRELAPAGAAQLERRARHLDQVVRRERRVQEEAHFLNQLEVVRLLTERKTRESGRRRNRCYGQVRWGRHGGRPRTSGGLRT